MRRAPLPKVIIVIGASGAGKGGLIKAALAHFNEKEAVIEFSVSVTDRDPRKDDVDGVTYRFVSPQAFDEMDRRHMFLEAAGNYGKRYGTLREPVVTALSEGRSMLLEVDPQGADKVLQSYPDAVTIFVDAPSPEALHQRLVTRGDAPEVVEKRMADYPRFAAARHRYQYLIINNNFSAARILVIAVIGRALAA